MKINLVALFSGLIFAFGLGIGGMTMPSKIVGFLDVAGAWDASLAFVMGGAVLCYAIIYRVALRRGTPLLAPAFAIPSRRDIDAPLITGAALFGIGWGLGGFCPGPAIVSLAWLDRRVLLFAGAMCLGMLLHRTRPRVATEVQPAEHAVGIAVDA